MNKVFFSFHAADSGITAALKRSLLRLAGGKGVEYWDRSAYTDTEYRNGLLEWLSKAHLAVVVHADHFYEHPDQRFELDAILAEKQRRPWVFHVVVVQSRRATLPPQLSRFDLLPAPDEALDGFSGDAQIVRTTEHIYRMLLDNNTPAALPAPGINLPLTLADLRERLLEVTDRANMSDVLVLLKTFVKDSGLMRNILQYEDDFTGLHLRERNQLADYQVKMAALKERVETLIHQTNEEYLLIQGWRPVFLIGYHSGMARRTPAFFPPNEDIQVPETLNLPVATQDTGSAERVGLLSYEQKLEFRRLLLLCQDALMVGKAGHAYGYCEQVRTGIDPESAQLYEYLLISFLQREGIQNIINSLMQGYERNFRHVKLYADRFYLYQHAQPPRCPSGTGTHNCNVAAEELGAALLGAYSAIHHDAILNTGDLDRDTQTRPIVRQCLDAAFALHQSMLSSKVFIESLLLELAGGGKVNWLKTLEVRDGTWQIVGNADFDLPGKIAEMQRMLTAADRRRSPEKQREMLREDLFWGLLLRCQQLDQQISDEQRQRHTQTDLRLSVIRIIQACIIGHTMFTQPGDELEAEKSLLRLGIELLLPNLLEPTNRYGIPESLHLDWFTLDANGQVVEDQACHSYQFEARLILEKMVADHAGQAGWPVIRSNIKEEVWQQYTAATEATYETVRDGLAWNDFRKINLLEARKRVVSCLTRWQTAYLAFPEKSIWLLDRIFTELCGDGLLIWFKITPLDLLTLEEARHYGYDSRTRLTWLLAQPGAWSEEQATQHLIFNLFKKTIEPAYQNVPAHQEAWRATVADLMARALLAFKKHPVMSYLDFVYRELTEETKLPWIAINNRGQWENVSHLFDGIDALLQMTRYYPDRFQPLDTRRRIADNRWRGQMRRYEAEISDNREENKLPERKIAAEIIRQCKSIFLFLPDRKYLELPLTELNDQGRIRWQAKALGIFAIQENHHENMLVPFDYKAERVEINLYITEQYKLYEQMLREIGVISTPA